VTVTTRPVEPIWHSIPPKKSQYWATAQYHVLA